MPKPSLADLAREHSRRRLPQKKRNSALRAAGYDPDGADGREYRKLLHRMMTISAVREIAADVSPHVVTLWTFPPEDFAAWLAMVTGTRCESYADYMALIAAAESELHREGMETRRVAMRVAEMQAALAERGLENTPDNRAAITASHT